MQRNKWLFSVTVISAMALATVACGDDDETDPTSSSTTSTASGMGGNGSGGMGNGGDATGGMGAGGDATGGMGAGGDGSGGMGETPIHGCTSTSADDMTGMATVDLNWVMNFSSCIRISSGTTVNWNGNFNSHPLDGGVSPTTDDNSPITMASPQGGMTSVQFDNAGAFPYFCSIHTGTMTGVVYVE